ncbi:HlyD family secretion protein [Laceyella putida]|uniref:Efflux RND transporter periplasmic adaptor subunit n=1 Tax=Laceyella putida TaxID=110101 RepID=A0ABW2RH35_9BACL
MLNAFIFLVIVALGISGYYYYYNTTNFIDTEDARVTGDIVPVSATVGGMVKDWKGQEGKTVTEGQVLGKVMVGNQATDIVSPIAGTIVQSKLVDGQMVAPGQVVAQVVDLSKLYIQANIEETVINDVRVGQEVDIVVDAEPDTKIEGKVAQIGLATNSMFSLIPQQSASGDYTKVIQRIPVKIEMDNYSEALVPGMNATIRIHK